MLPAAARQPLGEPVTGCRHDDKVRALDGEIDRGVEVFDADAPGEQSIERDRHVSRDTWARSHDRADGNCAAADGHVGLARAKRWQHEAGGPLGAEPLEDPSRGRPRVDDDRGERRADRGFDGPLVAGLDVDEVDERAQHAVEVAERVAADRPGDLRQRTVECLGACLAPRGGVLTLTERRLGALSLAAPRLEGLDGSTHEVLAAISQALCVVQR